MTETLDPSAVYLIVSRIPRGYVASYGQIAELAGYPRRARWVGRLLANLPPESTHPWHRVITSNGTISCPARQQAVERLIAEGVSVHNGRVNMRRHRWLPGA